MIWAGAGDPQNIAIAAAAAKGAAIFFVMYPPLRIDRILQLFSIMR
jgi:hypothetical protein